MRILLGLSGGVDSTYAALALKEAGHDVEAAVLMMHEYTSIDEAQESADSLGIPLHVIDVRDEFEKIVKSNFVSEYTNARTPNPCVVCNSEVKFFYLLKYATENGFDRIATGHYAGIKKFSEKDGEYYAVCRGADAKKDQTYMLWTLSQDVLKHVELPLGGLTKAEAREIAAQMCFPMAARKDSQDICFVPDGDYAAFIEKMTGKAPVGGDFIDREGRVLGRHKGQLHYTIGQRKGLGIALGRPAFVVEKSAEHNTVTLGENEDLFGKRLVAKNINLIPFDKMDAPMKLLAKARYRHEAAFARVEQIDADTLAVEFDEPQRAICQGQSLVLYDGDYVVGGGIIQ